MSSNKEISCSGTCWIETHVETKCEPPLIFKWILHPFTCHPPKYFSANWARDSWMKICFLYWSLPLPFSQNGDYIFWGLAFHKTLHQQTSTRKILQSRRGNAKRELNRKPRTYICGSTHTHHPLAEIGRSQSISSSLVVDYQLATGTTEPSRPTITIRDHHKPQVTDHRTRWGNSTEQRTRNEEQNRTINGPGSVSLARREGIAVKCRTPQRFPR